MNGVNISSLPSMSIVPLTEASVYRLDRCKRRICKFGKETMNLYQLHISNDNMDRPGEDVLVKFDANAGLINYENLIYWDNKFWITVYDVDLILEFSDYIKIGKKMGLFRGEADPESIVYGVTLRWGVFGNRIKSIFHYSYVVPKGKKRVEYSSAITRNIPKKWPPGGPCQ